MSGRYLLPGKLILLVLSAQSGDAYILSRSNAEADQQQNEDFVNGGFEEDDEGEEEKLNDVDETGQKNIQYHDDEDSTDEGDVDNVGHHGGHDHEHDVEEEEDGDFGDDTDEHHFSNSGFDVDVAVHVGAHHGADEHHFGVDGEYDAETDDDNDEEDDDEEEDRGRDRNDDKDRDKGNLRKLWTGPEPLEKK
ncbi:hypothetical protein SprV_0702397500 [Sparganum proliferum]